MGGDRGGKLRHGEGDFSRGGERGVNVFAAERAGQEVLYLSLLLSRGESHLLEHLVALFHDQSALIRVR